ncbi:GNAT family N-acetyltransferase [Mucilaginibacter pedocola]|uniref:Uncharacterized protein n=1 Tax=Mucilaginibacter pedocola TaxID=1792845 RepID=A0A1S9PB30_9SPHI|nr:hypothetical protein [Mucilaginibacter pedocola]OOQ58174.1 hypothetical protein BC343_11025 [Mucilaginibacter pedocola]
MPANNQPDRPQQLKLVKALGYNIINDSPIDSENVLQQHFRALNLHHLAELIDSILGELTVGDVQKTITVDAGPPPKLCFEYCNTNPLTFDDELYLHRTFESIEDGLIVKHDVLTLPTIYQKQNIGKAVLAAFLQQYEAAGVKKIKLLAALSTGGYAWARAGFKAIDKAEVDIILAKARQMLSPLEYSIIQRLYDGHYNSNAKNSAFAIEEWARLKFMKPVLLNSKWHGELDLTDIKELSKFRDYVTR